MVQQQRDKKEGEDDLLFSLLRERLARLELEDRLKHLEKLAPLANEFSLLKSRFNELKQRYIECHDTLEKTAEYYKNQLQAAARLQSSNKGIVTLDISANKHAFDILVEKIFEPGKKFIHFKYVDNKVSKVE
jgi:predicted nuclease with TOPRIM domain